jgi:hypothetical protein
MMKCGVCGKGKLRKGKVKEYAAGVYVGTFDALTCSSCGESFTDAETTRKIEEAAKKKGVWGLGASTKITKSGNSLAVRIPKKIADHLTMKNGKEVYLYPEKDRLIIEQKA